MRIMVISQKIWRTQFNLPERRENQKAVIP